MEKVFIKILIRNGSQGGVKSKQQPLIRTHWSHICGTSLHGRWLFKASLNLNLTNGWFEIVWNLASPTTMDLWHLSDTIIWRIGGIWRELHSEQEYIWCWCTCKAVTVRLQCCIADPSSGHVILLYFTAALWQCVKWLCCTTGRKQREGDKKITFLVVFLLQRGLKAVCTQWHGR